MWVTRPQGEFPIRAGITLRLGLIGAWQARTAGQQVNEVVNGRVKSNGGG